MNGVLRHRGIRRLGFLAVLLLSAVSVKANPVADGDDFIFEFGVILAITVAILVEAGCVVLLLRHARTPRLFLLWLIGMHLLTYPLFLGLLWLAVGLRPELAVAMGEGAVVLVEAGVIYSLCRVAPSAKAALPAPSIGKALFVSLVGNLCSAAAYPLLTLLNGWIAYAIGGSGME